jgi:hypothetical protein
MFLQDKVIFEISSNVASVPAQYRNVRGRSLETQTGLPSLFEK